MTPPLFSATTAEGYSAILLWMGGISKAGENPFPRKARRTARTGDEKGAKEFLITFNTTAYGSLSSEKVLAVE
jgi:hypothetical protein